MIIKKGWFSGLEIWEIHQQINWETCQQELYTVTETLNRNTAHSSTTEETQSREEKSNVEILKRISGNKTGKQSW